MNITKYILVSQDYLNKIKSNTPTSKITENDVTICNYVYKQSLSKLR